MEFCLNRLVFFTIVSLFLGMQSLKAQHAREVFGKNKVQYNDDLQDWWIYETNNIVYYWYGKSRNLAQFYINLAEDENEKIRSLFEYHPKDKIELVIFSDLSDLHQTNLDLQNSFTPQTWDLEPKINNQKILLYFNGDHNQSLSLLRKGIIQLYFNSMFSGTSLQEVVQKVISLKLPGWFESGLIGYLGEGWHEDDFFEMEQAWNQKNSFQRFYNSNPGLAGKSFWNFINTQFGEKSISNWLYMTRIQKDLNQATKLVFQQDLKALFAQWKKYYTRELQTLNHKKEKHVRLKLKKEEKIISCGYSELHHTFYLATNQNNRKRIRLLNTEKNTLKTIYKSGHRNKINIPDRIYPIYAEDADNGLQLIINEKRNRLHLHLLQFKTGEIMTSVLPEDIHEIYDVVFLDPNNIIFSGTNNSFSDIFLYNLPSRSYKKITDDIYDDLQIQIIKTGNIRKLIFQSNRPDTQSRLNKLDSLLPLDKFQLFSVNLNDLTTFHHETQSFNYGSIHGFQILDENEYLIHSRLQTKTVFYIQKDLNRYDLSDNQLENISLKGDLNKMLMIYKKYRNKYEYSLTTLDQKLKLAPQISEITTPLIKPKELVSIDSILGPKEDSTISFFVSKFGDPVGVKEVIFNEFDRKKINYEDSDLDKENLYENKISEIIKFNPNLSIAYRKRFGIEEISADLNNDLLFGGLNTYSGFNPDYNPPNIGILFKIRVKEVLENYHLEGGVRIPTDFIGSEAYVLLENNKKRWDHVFGIYRKSDRENIPNGNLNSWRLASNTILLNYQLKYALDPYQSFRLNNTIRNDHQFLLSSDIKSLDSLGRNIQSIGTRIEYVFDDAMDLSLNLKQGYQIKLFFEGAKRINTSLHDGIKVNPIKGLLLIAGLDARYHLPILRHSVFANRFYLNASFGQQRLLNHLGGTENWLIPKYSTESVSITDQEFAFSQQVTEVRGHPIGARKGSSAAVFSTELRVPFFQYILNQNWKNSFLRNLQFICFTDVGLSWNGLIPNIKEAEEFKIRAQNPAVIVDVIYKRDPVISGMGMGLRSSLFGYFLRFDYAWPVDRYGFSNPLPHLSLGLDF
ncbi:MAG: hypothetical protein JNK69_03610 [Saprospiraceae bacterium]|nr:hypothetical protein [Saprospiraceae bacterium]